MVYYKRSSIQWQPKQINLIYFNMFIAFCIITKDKAVRKQYYSGNYSVSHSRCVFSSRLWRTLLLNIAIAVISSVYLLLIVTVLVSVASDNNAPPTPAVLP